eukprot:TRINITY_DN8046_c0_g1_i3.p1 TRINITY_DN8046_c0_g1~~TRINITY_DN8046_c0_g1_i3.p1  ORF type:complete len:161 (-),score=27.68 TRINITY_DN8046_c0_g1_i3:42-524(-)
MSDSIYHFIPSSPDGEPLWSSDLFPLQPMETFSLPISSSTISSMSTSSHLSNGSLDSSISSESPSSTTTTTPVPIPPVPVAQPQQPPEPLLYLQQVTPGSGLSTTEAKQLGDGMLFDTSAATAEYNSWTCKRLSEELGRRLLARSGNKVCSFVYNWEYAA